MENNEGHRKLPPSGSNIELEKFKRRLIRAVARMLLHEKRNENEVWAGLRKETGCDCKELWGRMHALTIKKLDRLLKVQDRVDLLPKAARMSITDWLMFDTVLVHEEFDVIGMTETTAEDKKILVDLFDLVEKYTIEFLAGDELTEAWLKVTLEYNKDGRQCTPMLLQRRWYQLKLATRARFYKFWSMYKGIIKRQYLGEPFKPTALQAKIALRYKPLVIKPFMLWEELIKNNLVVLPETFERKENIKSANSGEIDPDVMCVEPVVEIIDLDAESDLELEYRKTDQKNHQTQIAIKQEPKDKNELDIDENTPYENRQEKILHFAEAAMEATAMELDEIELADDIDGFLSPNPGVEIDIPLNEHYNKDQNPNHTYLQGENVLPIVDDENNKPVVKENACKANLVNISEANGGLVIGNETNSVFENIAELHLVEDVEAGNNDIEMQKEQEPVLPQITSVYGGVDVSNETLSKISLLPAQISNCAKKTILENKDEPEVESSTSIPLNNDSSDELIFIDDVKMDADEDANKDASASVKTIESKLNCNVNTNPDKPKSSWFGDLANDIDFADDGIQLVDDGIAYIDDESEYQMPEIKTEIKSIIKIEEHEAVLDKMEEDEPKVDEKLLMVPVVNMVKLDDMGILPIHLLNHIGSKCLIDIITSKNNPIKKKVRLSEPIKEEIITSYPTKKEADDSESSDEDVIDDVKRVKLSSILLQKPRFRTYNPIQLCKNPDFNTRLKKLNVGFFSSARNRLLLKSCKPLSIDVSKAFEHKLVNGTVYLEMNDSDDLHKNTEPGENNQNVSVIPSAMAVQSLIDNTRGDIPPVSYSQIAPKPAESALLTCERNKIINLPDISEIRRINQNLLTAEVTPLQLKSGSTHVPVTLVTAANIESNPSHVYTKYFKAGPASRKKLMQPQVVDITKEDNTGKDDSQTKNVAGNKDSLKPINKLPPWKPRHKPEVPWYSSRNSIYAEDTLLALDSLNKMLYLITEGDGTLPVPSGKGNKGKRKGAMRKEISTVKTLLKGDDNDDVQVVSEIKLNNAVAKKSRKGKIVQSKSDKKQKLLYCCWARERICQLIFSKRQITKHNCPFPLCLCCCRTALVEFIRKKEEVSTKPKKPTGALPLGDIPSELSDTGTEDVTFVSENKNISADVAEIIPINEKTAAISTSDSPSCKVDKETEIITIESEVNTDTVVCGDDSAEEVVTQMTQEISSDVTIGAEISVTTSKSTVAIDSNNTTATETEIIPIVKPKPLIRVRAAPGSRKTAGTNLRKKIVQEQSNRVQQSRHLVLTQNLEVVEKGIADDLAKPFRIREISPETLPKQLLNSTVANVLPKTHSNQKMIYLNSKQISELPSDNPIFLGKNKILLTTAIFPPNFKAFEAFQANIRQTLALPKGIQLLLLPSGRLTYIRDRKIDVNEEFMASLPLLIAAIQQQINGSVAQPVENCSLPTEVIDLSGDETTCVTENTDKQSELVVSKDNVDQTKSSEKLHTENTKEIRRSDDIPTVNLEETKTTESAANVNTQSDVITPESAITPETEENRGKFKNILSDLMAMSGIESTDVTSISKECLSPVKKLELPTANVEGESSQITDCKILPVQPIQHSINPPLLQPINSTLDQNSSLQLVHTSKDDNTVDKTEPSINKVMTKSLTPITSLSELKYACAQSGLFFKLDLDTGLLVPINVCMKKFTDSSQRRQHYVRKLGNIEQKTLEPKPIIDLTDDDVSEIPAITQAQLVSNLVASQSIGNLDENVGNNIQGTSNIDKSTSSSDLDVTYEVVSTDSESVGTSSCNIDPRISGNNVNKDGKVKPLKLFKSSVGRPTILERKLKEIQKRIFDAKLTQDMIRRKLKRKQEFESLIRVERLGKLDKRVSSDDSSDEEPLAKIATKIRAAEKAGTENNENVSETAEDEKETDLPPNSRLYMEVENIHKLPDEIDEPMDDEPNVDLPIEEDEDMPIQCLDETILNEDEPEEYCILGV